MCDPPKSDELAGMKFVSYCKSLTVSLRDSVRTWHLVFTYYKDIYLGLYHTNEMFAPDCHTNKILTGHYINSQIFYLRLFLTRKIKIHQKKIVKLIYHVSIYYYICPYNLKISDKDCFLNFCCTK